MGAAYIVRKRARFVSINGPVNLPYGTPVDAVDGFLVHNGRPLCAVTSESAHRYFARNDDGNGKARGALIGAIMAKLERKRRRPSNALGSPVERPGGAEITPPGSCGFLAVGPCLF